MRYLGNHDTRTINAGLRCEDRLEIVGRQGVLEHSYPECQAIDCHHEPSQLFVEHCMAVKPVDGLASRKDFDVLKLGPWLGNILVLEEIDGGHDFRYRVYGTNIAEFSGFDMTGRKLSDVLPPELEHFRITYRDALDYAKITVARNLSVGSGQSNHWLRVICPVVDDKGRKLLFATSYAMRADGTAEEASGFGTCPTS